MKEEEIRNRIITRTLGADNLYEHEAQKEPEEYGPKPPAELVNTYIIIFH